MTDNPGTIEQYAAKRPPADARAFVESMKGHIARSLPTHLRPERVTRLFLTALTRNPRLAECTQESFAGAILTAAALGLEPNTPTGECYLVPYRDKRRGVTEAQLIIGYQGWVRLFWNSPDAAYLDAQAVYEGDEFDYALGTDPYLRHRPSRKPHAERGDVTCYYAVAGLKSGARRFVVLSPDEVRDLRRGAVGPSGDIPDPQRWMERKVAIRQVLKLLPKSADVAVGMVADEAVGSDLHRSQPWLAVERDQVADQLTAAASEDATPFAGGSEPEDDRP